MNSSRNYLNSRDLDDILGELPVATFTYNLKRKHSEETISVNEDDPIEAKKAKNRNYNREYRKKNSDYVNNLILEKKDLEEKLKVMSLEMQLLQEENESLKNQLYKQSINNQNPSVALPSLSQISDQLFFSGTHLKLLQLNNQRPSNKLNDETQWTNLKL